MRLAAAILVASVLWSTSIGGAIYKWVDENGKVHYTDSPPDPTVKELDLPARPDSSVIRDSRKQADRLLKLDRRKQQIRQRAKEREEREARERAAALKEPCKNARNDLNTLRMQAPVYRTNKQGERVFIEDHERPQEIADLQRFIKRYCRR